MIPARVHAKVLAAGLATAPPSEIIAVFHRWIQTRKLDELLIDVTDYSHVEDGPGVMLIGHHGNYALDRSGGRPGLLYARKRDEEGTAPSGDERLTGALRRALSAARHLENEPQLVGKLRFGGTVEVRIADRLDAPNEPATWQRLRPAFEALAERLGASARPIDGDRRALFGVELIAQEGSPAVLLGRLG